MRWNRQIRVLKFEILGFWLKKNSFYLPNVECFGKSSGTIFKTWRTKIGHTTKMKTMFSPLWLGSEANAYEKTIKLHIAWPTTFLFVFFLWAQKKNHYSHLLVYLKYFAFKSTYFKKIKSKRCKVAAQMRIFPDIEKYPKTGITHETFLIKI